MPRRWPSQGHRPPFELRVRKRHHVTDDYAHHPTEIRHRPHAATPTAVGCLRHTYRTKSLFSDFAHALTMRITSR
jgi:UDP-N-acetylmuramate-alanine ligase